MNSMKHLYLSIIFAISSFCGFAQNFTVTPANSVTTTISLDTYITSEIDFNNTSGDLLYLAWDLIDATVPSSFDYSFCDYNTCYDATYIHGTMAAISPGNSGFIKVNLSTSQEGWAHFKFAVYNVNNPSEADTVDFWFNGIAEVKQIVKEEISIYPNPVNSGDNWTIKNLENNSLIEVYNSLGQKVLSTKNYSSSSVILEGKLNKGAYIVRILHDGERETRKLIIR